MTDVDLTIRGRIESLRLEDGDKILVTFDRASHVTAEHIEFMLEELREKFPGHEVICLYGLSIALVKGDELKCRVCQYHYPVRTLTVTDKGPECTDKKRCGHNQAQQAKYRRVRHERV